MNNTYCLIMAGGEGTRFAPLSTPERPKQFLNFIGERTFIQQTRDRISAILPPDRILVATNRRYVSLVREQLPDVPAENIIAEPEKKNTAPCIAYAARLIQERDPNAVMAVLPSDHVIFDAESFQNALTVAVGVAREKQLLVTFGIEPKWPATGYGYIKAAGGALGGPTPIYTVDSFTEKPNETAARRFISEGSYYWNSGIFIWSVRSILEEVKACLPDIYTKLTQFSRGSDFIEDFFKTAESVSIDYGVMEKSKRVGVIPCDIGWNDVGTWQSLKRLSQADAVVIQEQVLKIMEEQLGLNDDSI